MRLTVLGCYGPFPAQGKACSGYLIESKGAKLLMDCGSGVLSNLTRVANPVALCGAVISHLHFDHASDLGVMRYLLETFGGKLDVIAPKTPADTREVLLNARCFSVTDAMDGTEYSVGPFTVKLTRAEHPVETYSVRVTDGESVLFYTGDTGVFPELQQNASGADTVLADTCFWDSREGRRNFHLTIPEAAALAKEAGARQLICSHLFGGIPDAEVELPAGLSDFPHTVIAKQFSTYDI